MCTSATGRKQSPCGLCGKHRNFSTGRKSLRLQSASTENPRGMLQSVSVIPPTYLPPPFSRIIVFKTRRASSLLQARLASCSAAIRRRGRLLALLPFSFKIPIIIWIGLSQGGTWPTPSSPLRSQVKGKHTDNAATGIY